MPEPKRECQLCLWWKRREDAAGKGERRRSAPGCTLSCMTSAWSASWPLTMAGDWCGEWQPPAVRQQYGEESR